MALVLSKCLGTGNRHQPFFGCQLETGMSHFFGVAPRGVPCGVPLNPGVTKKKRAAVLPREDWNFCDIGATNVKETRLGEPVLIGRARTHWASHQTRLGEPVLRGRWASPYSLGGPVGRASTKRPGEPTFTVASTVANACACLALLRSAPGARSALCLLGTFSQVPAHVPLGTSACPLGTVPARHV